MHRIIKLRFLIVIGALLVIAACTKEKDITTTAVQEKTLELLQAQDAATQKRIKFTMADLSEAVKANAFVAKIDHEKEIEVDRYLNKLPSKSAIVFRLKVIEGYSHEEIADLLQIKTTASRAIFSRARRKLQYYFKDPTTTF